MTTSLNTPKDFWNKLNTEFEFNLDAAADESNHLCDNYFSEDNCAFKNDWSGSVWVSPPWMDDNLDVWVAKAVLETELGHADSVVMFLPVRPNAAWFQYVAQNAEIRMIQEELKWDRPGVIVEPSMLAIFKSFPGQLPMQTIKSDKEIEFDIDASCKYKAIKIIDLKTRRIGAYATIWGELDCDGERMTKQALQPSLNRNHAPAMFWKHGLDKLFGSRFVGDWDRSSFKVDDRGLFVEGNVTDDEAWEKITNSGSIGLSVGTIWYLVKREKAKDQSVNIVDWPLLDISIMEGGKQCVPSAFQKLQESVGKAYKDLAAKMGLPWDEEWVDRRTPVQRWAVRILSLPSGKDFPGHAGRPGHVGGSVARGGAGGGGTGAEATEQGTASGLKKAMGPKATQRKEPDRFGTAVRYSGSSEMDAVNQRRRGEAYLESEGFQSYRSEMRTNYFYARSQGMDWSKGRVNVAITEYKAAGGNHVVTFFITESKKPQISQSD